MESEVQFFSEKEKKIFEEITDYNLKKHLKNAFRNLMENAFCGLQIPKRLIPKDYIKKFGNLTNLWKYNLPDAWRLIFTIENDKVNILSIILEWMDHKTYERRFKY